MASRIEGVPRDRQIALTGLVLGPVLLVTGLAIGMEPWFVERLIPIEPAWVQGAIALPMMILAPAALSLAWGDESVARAGLWVSRAVAVAIALGLIGWVAVNVSYIGCQPVTNPTQALPVGAVWGGAAGVGYFAAVAAGRWYASSERPVAAVVAAAGVGLLAIAADILAFVLLFPPLLCAAPRVPA